MTELVGDDELDLAWFSARKKRVPQHDAPRLPEAGDVCVVLPRPPARVRHEHVPNGNACAHRQLPELIGQLLVRERLEAVEDRLEHNRRDEADEQDEQSCADGGRDRPPARKRMDGGDEREERDRRQDDADPETLQPVNRPSPNGLRREAPLPLVEVPPPEGERCVEDRLDDDDQCAESKRLTPPRQAVDDPVQRVAEAGERKEPEDDQAERNAEDADDVDGAVVPARALDLLGGENLLSRT